MDTTKLRETRATLVKKGRALLEKAEGENRKLNTEERAEYDNVMREVDDLKERVDAIENLDSKDDEDEEEDDDADEENDREGDDEDNDRDEQDDDSEDERSRRRKPAKTVKQLRSKGRRTAPAAIGGEKRVILERRAGENEFEFRNRVRRAQPEYRKAFCNWLMTGKVESRAIQADSDIVGGYLVAPQQFVADLIIFVNNLVFIRQKATKYTVSAAQSLGAPSLDTDIADSDWTSELATGSEDSSMAFGKRELHPHPLAKRIKVSNKLLRVSAINAEQLVRERLAYKFAVTEEKGFMTGTGVNQPLGLFTASTTGISTGRDVTAGTTTNPTADGLISTKYSVKVQYQMSGEWLFHRDAIKLIRQLKDGMGQYLWAPGLTAGAPDTLLDRPYTMSEYVPNTFTTGLYFGLFGDLSKYWIADAEEMMIQRLVELYAETNQTGFIARREIDAMPVLEEAFARCKLA